MAYFILAFVLMQRVLELIVAKNNERRLLAKGAYEVGAAHYPVMIALHASFFVSFMIEVFYVNAAPNPQVVLVAIFIVLQLLRIWCIASLGVFWNTKIIILPGAELVAKGPYTYIKHPNYVVVCLEILILPLMFQAYFTAVCFTLLNVWMLSVRIPMEEKALNL